MADYAPTAASVAASVGASTKQGTAGATIVQGDVLYRDSADSNKLKLSDANSATAVARTIAGIALNAAVAGQPITYLTKDPNFSPGFTIAIGDLVVLSRNAGKMCPAADSVSGDYVLVVGAGITGNKINITGFDLAAGAAKA